MNEEVLGCEVFKYLPLFLLTWTKDFFFSLLSSSSVSVPELSRSDFFSLSLNFSSSPFSFLFSAWIEIWKAWQPDIFFYNLASFEMKKREMNNSASLQLSKWMVKLGKYFCSVSPAGVRSYLCNSICSNLSTCILSTQALVMLRSSFIRALVVDRFSTLHCKAVTVALKCWSVKCWVSNDITFHNNTIQFNRDLLSCVCFSQKSIKFNFLT